MRIFIISVIAFLSSFPCTAGELMRVAGEPTAGVIAPGTFNVAMSTFPTTGLKFSVTVGILPRFMAGLGYGGWNITGVSDPDWFEEVYLKARFRVFDEKRSFPAIALGYDNEGEHFRSGAEYLRPARDFYLVFSKNFAGWGGDMGFHFGVNLTTDGPDHLGSWFGLDKSFPGGFGIAADWDLATDGDTDYRFEKTGGFVDIETYWESFGQVRIGLRFSDILETGGAPYRSLVIDFLGLI
ncbi:MAG: hypothetical protein KAR40_09290 [Candidatus Sabulitectum sp.]|nr:hypothetical protein [Candidatus Sabulitectum sp.]